MIERIFGWGKQHGTTVRISLLAASVLIVIAAFGPHPAEAREAPWCAVSPMGWGDEINDCSFWSLEACIPYVIAGNRGFCNQNPRWQGPCLRCRSVPAAGTVTPDASTVLRVQAS